MPRIFDNIEQHLLPSLCETLQISTRADFCIGYFNLRGWRKLDSYIENWSGDKDNCCRLLIGMQELPKDSLRKAFSFSNNTDNLDNKTALQLKKRLAKEFREQLTLGAPTNEDEIGLRKLSVQLKSKKVIVKIFLRHSLHAKLYLLFRDDPNNPITGYLGSSNLTIAGLLKQGELNIDVLDHDACQKLSRWFEERWNDRWCIDISDELAEIIDESWARVDLIPPYYIYLKIAYHLSQEAREGLAEFRIPKDFENKLFDFQKAAVKIAAHHLNKRNGVLIGDVVGLGKTLMATAVARIFEDDLDLETLIISPKNLVKMWEEDYREKYRIRGKVISMGNVIRELPNLRRYRIVIIDESQNLRNRQGKRYRAIHEYIQENESKCILLSATPYNKTYLDLSNQLRLFVSEDETLGIRPEKYIKEIGETEFIRQHQCSLHSLAAFEKSEYPSDWRELMRLYLVRRTRSFIIENYAETDPENGREYLTFEDGTKSYFPVRKPMTKTFILDENDPDDQYAKLFVDEVVDSINSLNLPRYGLGNYIDKNPSIPPTDEEIKQFQDLSRAGKRLMGFCRINIFKRLESSGKVFIQSIERHILRNYIYIYAIQNAKDLPIGTQEASILDTRFSDIDTDSIEATSNLFVNELDEESSEEISTLTVKEFDFEKQAEEIYNLYITKFRHRFKWIRPGLFIKQLEKDLRCDIKLLEKILDEFGEWLPEEDTKLDALVELLTKKHPNEKVIIFTQFADTVYYIEKQLEMRGIKEISGVTGDSYDPTALAHRFSPESNDKRAQIAPENELRILVSTDILSEGQNLQDCSIVVNYDLPWAIIRLVQRAGRVDRIGQKAENIICYSFLPADGVERIIRLRDRVRQRLRENAEVVGTDEAFFEDDKDDQVIVDLYNEKSGLLDDVDDKDVDFSSYAYQIWNNAIKENPKLKKIIPELPPVVFSTKKHEITEKNPEGVLVYLQTAEGNDALEWINDKGESVTESQFAILNAAECSPDEQALLRRENHHELVKKGVESIIKEEKYVGGQLGRPSGARFRTYERLKRYAEEVKGTLFETKELHKTIEEIYKYPLRQSAIDILNRQLRSGISDQDLAALAISLTEEDRLCIIHEEEREFQEPRIICSMGLRKKN